MDDNDKSIDDNILIEEKKEEDEPVLAQTKQSSKPELKRDKFGNNYQPE